MVKGKTKHRYGCPQCGLTKTFSWAECLEHMEGCCPDVLSNRSGLQQRCCIGHPLCVVVGKQEGFTPKRKIPDNKRKLKRKEPSKSLAARKTASNHLQEGVWESPNFPSSYGGSVLVLWDLDQGRWDSQEGMFEFAANIQQLVKQNLGVDGQDKHCVFIGGVNTKATNRRFWRDLIAKNERPSSSLWSSLFFQLNVVASRDQAVDETLIEVGTSAISSRDPPSAVVLVTTDNDFTPILQHARAYNVPSMVLYRLKPSLASKRITFAGLKDTCDEFVVVDKLTGTPLLQ